MNHPGNPALLELLTRLLWRAGIPVKADPALLASYPYTLDEIKMPAYPAVHAAHLLGFPVEDRVVGKRVEVDAKGVVTTAEPFSYRWLELFGTYYGLYDAICDAQPDTALTLRNTAPWVD
jgi:hypothetical protein